MVISSDLITWQYGVNHLNANLAGTETVTYYIHDATSDYNLYPVGGEYINTYSHDTFEEVYIEAIFSSIDTHIDLDFKRVYTNDSSAIDIYKSSGYASWASNVVGSATTRGSGASSYFDVVWKDRENWDSAKYTIIHEIGHSLGLDHPGGVGFNPAYNTDDTVMSYNVSLSTGYPSAWTQSDINALVSIWGREDTPTNTTTTTPITTVSIPSPTNSNDTLTGDSAANIISALYGDDSIDSGAGNDIVYGNQGNDRITAGTGADYLYGGQGGDTLYGNQGADKLYGNFQDDVLYGGKDNDWQHGGKGADRLYGNLGIDEMYGGRDNDWLHGGQGNDKLWGNHGADKFCLSKGQDQVMDFNAGEGDLISLPASTAYSLAQQGTNLLIDAALGDLLLINTSINSFNAVTSIVYG
ncbi:Hemolysin, chromosomal [Prochlorococcus marinus str. MIT 1313]|uniref:zinc-dependent metalloprotease family protein n=1 Tax=Prochlorococcus TaxID=1218 RepID=UPI0007C113ED|nr:zinc-dependent metalloprotease family protein [Prochlorococcus marinus]KZR70574.1 Hemolysin, chromosomal [Prochlorococcus marinus str. MIT 1313]